MPTQPGHTPPAFGELPEHLTADQAAGALGIAKASLYVYVSRGLLTSERGWGTNARTYRKDEVMGLIAKKQAGSAAGALHYGAPVLDSAITAIDPDDGPVYRGHSAVELARSGASIESVAQLLWTGGNEGRMRNFFYGIYGWFPLPENDPRHTKPILDPALPLIASVEGGVELFARAAPRYETANEMELAVSLMGAMCTAVSLRKGLKQHAMTMGDGGTGARQLARALIGKKVLATDEMIDAVRRAMVLCADHELNPSAFAARVAASTGAGLAQCVRAALATFSGPLHGGACDSIEEMLDGVDTPKAAEKMIGGRLERGEEVPGFSTEIYPDGDPRSDALLELPRVKGERFAPDGTMGPIVNVLSNTMGVGPSIDLALVAMCKAFGLPKGSAAVVFAVGRAVGWIAHAFEQRESGEIVRPRARFTGPARRGQRSR